MLECYCHPRLHWLPQRLAPAAADVVALSMMAVAEGAAALLPAVTAVAAAAAAAVEAAPAPPALVLAAAPRRRLSLQQRLRPLLVRTVGGWCWCPLTHGCQRVCWLLRMLQRCQRT